MARLTSIILAAFGAARGETRLFGGGHAHARAILAKGGDEGAIIGLRVFLGRAAHAIALEDVGPVDGFVRRAPKAGDVRPAIGGLELAIAALKRAVFEIADVHLRCAVMNFDRERAAGN